MAKYPSIEVGDLWTATLADSMLPDFIRKTAATLRPSTTTLADDPDLVVALLANAIYFVEMYVRYATTSAAGFKTAWTVPSGVTTSTRTVMGAGSTQVDANADNDSSRHGVHNYATAVSYGDRNSVTNQLWTLETSIVATTTAGNCALQWAQDTSTAVDTALSGNSFIRATRIG